MDDETPHPDAFVDDLMRIFWTLPFAFCAILLYGCVKTMSAYGADPLLQTISALAALGLALIPIFPTRRDLMAHWTTAVERVDASFRKGRLTQEAAQERLAEASTYAHSRNVIWWPLWWLSERGKLRRLIARIVRESA